MAAAIVACRPQINSSQEDNMLGRINMSGTELMDGDEYLNIYTLSNDSITYPPIYVLSSTVASLMEDQATRAPPSVPIDGGIGWFEGILLVLCIIGVSGNILNLLVLTRRRFCSSLNKLESSANYGLIALAVSDLCFCIMVLPHVFISGRSDGSIKVIQMYYRIIGVATINLFLMTSTWIIIIIAVNRVIVVVYPLRAKSLVSRQSTVVSIILVYIFSAVLTLPYYLHIAVQPCQTTEGFIDHQYYAYFNQDITDGMRAYIKWVWPITADFIPLMILGICNARLIYEIRRTTSAKHGALVRRSSQGKIRSSGSKVTVTLIAIIVMYLLLVTPCEVMKYINPYKSWGRVGFIIANATNALQTANFAFNFVVYCVVNVTFRQTLKDMIRPSRNNTSSMSIKSINGLPSELEERQAMICRDRNSRNGTTLTAL